MPPNPDHEAAQLRMRAHHLHRLAITLADTSIVDMHRSAGDDVWRGPVADRCRDDLLVARRRVEAAVDDLRHQARVLERRADEASLRAVG